MTQCPTCGQRLHRRHRKRLEKLFYTDIYLCRKCGGTFKVRRLLPHLNPRLAPYTHCVRCGTFDVHRVVKRDRIDPVSNSPSTWVHRFTGAPLYKCIACRLQYYDWRPLHPNIDR
jgi:predicted nucleic acid-binding Zn ribbon protein